MHLFGPCLTIDGFAVYHKAAGGVVDEVVGLLSFTPKEFAALESLFFHINGVTFELTANAQIFPVSSYRHPY